MGTLVFKGFPSTQIFFFFSIQFSTFTHTHSLTHKEEIQFHQLFQKCFTLWILNRIQSDFSFIIIQLVVFNNSCQVVGKWVIKVLFIYCNWDIIILKWYKESNVHIESPLVLNIQRQIIHQWLFTSFFFCFFLLNHNLLELKNVSVESHLKLKCHCRIQKSLCSLCVYVCVFTINLNLKNKIQ